MFNFLNMKIQFIKFVAKHPLPFKKTLCQQILCKGRKDLNTKEAKNLLAHNEDSLSDFTLYLLHK